MNSPIVPSAFNNDYQIRRLALGFARFNFHGTELDIYMSTSSYNHKEEGLRLPIPMVALYVSPNSTMGQLANAAGLKVYDHALPHIWVKREFLDNGLPFPRGVWSYDDNRHSGSFVSLVDILQRIANTLVMIGLTSLGMPFGATVRSEGDNRDDPSPVLYAGDIVKVMIGDHHWETVDAVVQRITVDDVWVMVGNETKRVVWLGDDRKVWALVSTPQPHVETGDMIQVLWHGKGGYVDAIVESIVGDHVYARQQFSAMKYLLHWHSGVWQV